MAGGHEKRPNGPSTPAPVQPAEPPAVPAPDAPAEGKPRRKRRWLRRTLWGLLFLLVGVPALVLLTLQNDWARAQLVDFILGTVNPSIAGEIRVGAVEGTLLGDVALVDVRILDPDGTTALRVDRVAVELDLWSLLDDTIRIESVEIERPALVVQDAEGRVAIARAFAPAPGLPLEPPPEAPPEPAPPILLDVMEIELDDGRVQLSPASDAPTLDELRLRAVIRLGKGVGWEGLSLTGVAANLPFRKLAVESDGVFEGADIEVNRFSLDTDAFGANVRGTVGDLGLSKIDFVLDGQRGVWADVDALAPLVAGAGGEPSVGGRVALTGGMSGTLSDLEIGLTLEHTGAAGDKPDEGDVEGDAYGLGAGRLRIEGRAGLGLRGPRYAVIIAGAGLRPGAVAGDLPLELGGDLRVALQGEGDPTTTGWSQIHVGLTHLLGLPDGLAAAAIDARVERGALAADVQLAGPGPERLAVHAEAPWLPPAPVTVEIRGADVALAPLGALLDRPELAGTLSALSLTAGAFVDGSAVRDARADGDIVLKDLKLAPSPGERAGLQRLSLGFGAEWSGEGLPRGSVDLDVRKARGAGARVGRLTGRLKAVPRGGGLRVTGSLSGAGLAHGRDTAVTSLEVPVDLTVPLSGGRLPHGTLGLTVTDAHHAGNRVERVELGGGLKAEGAVVTLTGPLTVEGVRTEAGQAVGRLDAKLDLGWDTGRGRPRGGLSLEVRDVAVAPDTGADYVGARVAFIAPRNSSSFARLKGTIGLRGVRAPGDVAVGVIHGPVDVELGAGLPNARAELKLKGLRSSALALKNLGVDVSLHDDGLLRAEISGREGASGVELAISGELPRGDGAGFGATIERLEFKKKLIGLRLERPTSVRLSRDGRLRLGRLRLKGLGGLGASSLAAEGVYDPARDIVDGKVTLKGVNLELWAATAEALFGVEVKVGGARPAGTFELDAGVRGSIRAPRAQLRASLARGRIGDVDGVDLDVYGALSPDGVELTLGGSLRDGTAVNASIQLPVETDLQPEQLGVHLPPDARFVVDVDVENGSLELLRPLLPQSRVAPLSGKFTANILLGGTLDHPRGTINVQTERLTYGRLADAQLRFETAVADAGTRLKLWLASAGRENASLLFSSDTNVVSRVMAGVKRGDLLPTLQALPFNLSLKLDDFAPTSVPLGGAGSALGRAVLQAELTARGPAGALTLDGDLSVAELPVGDAEADVGLEFRMEERACHVGGRVVVRGRELLTTSLVLPDLPALASGMAVQEALRDRRVQGRVDVPRASVETLAALSPSAGEALADLLGGGDMSATVSLQGSPGGPQVAVLAHASGPRKRAEWAPPTLVEDLHVAVRVTGNATSAAAVLDQGGDRGLLSLKAALELGTETLLAPDGPPLGESRLHAELQSRDFDLRGLASFMPAVFGPSVGTLEANVVVDGTLMEPALDGRLLARFDELSLAATGMHHEDVEIGLTLDEEGFRLSPPLELRHGKGMMRVEADVRAPRLDPTAMTLAGGVTFDEYRVLRRDDMTAKLVGNLKLGGTVAVPRITGAIEVTDARVSPEAGGRQIQRIGTPNDVEFVSAEELGAAIQTAAEREEAAAQPPELDIVVKVKPRRLYVTNEMADIFLGADLHVLTKDRAVTIEGRVDVVEGTLNFYGRPFTLADDSRVVFVGADPPNPRLDIRARHSIAEVDLSPIDLESTPDSHILLSVGGSANEPRLEMASDPSMDETNIISVLLTGGPVGAFQSDEESQADRAAMGLVVGLATGQFTRLIERDLPIDVFKVEAGEAGLVDARIRVGKRVSRNLLILYEGNLGADEDENANEIKVQYRLTRRLQVETHFGDAGRGGVDLLLRWRW